MTPNTKYVQGFENRFYIGDRVLQTENDGERNIFNGEVGFVENVFQNTKPEDTCLVARFKSTINGEDKLIEYKREDLSSLSLGYSMTIHRLQGSEYDYVIVALDESHKILLDRCMLYTAITRAKKLCILATQEAAFKEAMKTSKVNNRQTWLSLKVEQMSA